MREDLVDVLVGPAEHFPCVAPSRVGQIDTRVQERFGVGLHARSVVAVLFRFDATRAQRATGRVRPERSTK